MFINFCNFSGLALAVQSILVNWFASLSITVDKRFKFGVTYGTALEQAKAIAGNCRAADGRANPGASHALVRPMLN